MTWDIFLRQPPANNNPYSSVLKGEQRQKEARVPHPSATHPISFHRDKQGYLCPQLHKANHKTIPADALLPDKHLCYQGTIPRRAMQCYLKNK